MLFRSHEIRIGHDLSQTESRAVGRCSVASEFAGTNFLQQDRTVFGDLMSAARTDAIGGDDDDLAEFASDLDEQSQSGSVDAVVVGQQEFHGASFVNSGRLG